MQKEEQPTKQPRLRVNETIRVPEVRLVDADGTQLGIVPIDDARRRAAEAHMDLVEVAPLAKPPVCKIVDYGKVLFDQRQRKKAQKKKQHQIEIKEIKLKPKIGKHDYEIKVKRARKFLVDGDKVKFTIQFRAREVTHPEIGHALEERIVEDLLDVAELEGPIRRARRIHNFLLTRRKDFNLQKYIAKHGPIEKTAPAEKDKKADLKSGEGKSGESSQEDRGVLTGGDETAILP